MNKNQYDVATVNIKKLRLDNEIDNNRSLRRPYLSDNRPIIGEKINCIKAKIFNKKPNAKAPTCNETAKKGRSGIIIAYPVASMKMVIKITNCFEKLLVCFSILNPKSPLKIELGDVYFNSLKFYSYLMFQFIR